jgi:hypothetical protein
MAKPKTNFTELTHQVVRDAAEPLSLEEIAARVLNLSGGETTKNLKQTIRASLGQSTAIVYLPDRGYGWKSRLLNGAIQRIVLEEVDLAEHELMIDDFQRDLFQPNGPGDYKYGVHGLPKLELADGPTIEVGAIPRPFDDDLLSLPDTFWAWLERQGARPGDSLLLSVIDADARRYGMSYEPAAKYDEEAIAARGEELVEAAVDFVHRARGRTTIPEIAAQLNPSGIFHQIPAPPPFDDLWTPDVWGPLVDEYDVSPYLLGGYDQIAEDMLNLMLSGAPLDANATPGLAGQDEGPIITVGEHGSYRGDLGVDTQLLQARIDEFLKNTDQPIPADDPLLSAISTIFAAMALPSPTGIPYLASHLVESFGDDDEILDWIEHGAELGMVTIDPAYEALIDAQLDAIPAPIPALEPRSGTSRTFVLRVTYRYQPDFWCEIEIAADQYLHDLHLAIQRAFAWDNDHLYSFYTGKRPYDSKTEIGSPTSHTRRRADEVSLDELNLHLKQKFLYLFDFGDNHLFDIQVKKINPKAPPGLYPHVVADHGGRLAQYEGEEEWGDE